MEHTNALIPSRPGLTAYVYADIVTLALVVTLVLGLLWFVLRLVGLIRG